MTGLRNITFDDRDAVNLKYQGFWFLTGTYNASRTGDSGTLASTSDTQANVTFVFPTPAVAFYYYGMPRCCGGLYGICIDCDPNNRVFENIDAVNPTDDGKNPPILLFSKTFSTAGVHEIILQNQVDNRYPGHQLTLDRFVIEVQDPDAVVTSPPASSTGTSQSTGTTSSSPGASLPASPSPSTSSSRTASSTSPASSSTESKSPPLGAIVGISLAAAVVLIGFFAGMCFWRRRRRMRDEQNALADPSSLFAASPLMSNHPGAGGIGHDSALHSTLTPYTYPLPNHSNVNMTEPQTYPYPPGGSPTPSHLTHNVAGVGAGVMGAASLPTQTSSSSKDRRIANPWPSVSTFAEATSTSLPYAASQVSTSSSQSRRGGAGRRLREVDGGPLPEDDEDDMYNPASATLPPEYGAVFPQNLSRSRSNRNQPNASNGEARRNLPPPPASPPLNSAGSTYGGTTNLGTSMGIVSPVPDLSRTTYATTMPAGEEAPRRSSIAKS